ncbi:hypothetical protein ABK905_24495 [Acerihabitans sp. KWT182]|uniref:Type 4a pilus biogenesis protein PilO n=1 Tax=Acerihabitans sp. KWT182 TaxID=3157919 RepID=A0AAU7Q8L9_9GAMM
MGTSEGGLWRGTELPWPLLTSALAAAAALLGLCAFLFLRPGLLAREDLRRDVLHIENTLSRHKRERAGWPSPARLDARISTLREALAACETAYQEPAVFIKSIDPGPLGKMSWRAATPSSHRRGASERWAVAVSTDYQGLRRVLDRLAARSGGVSLTSFAVAVRGGALDVEFELEKQDTRAIDDD